MRPSLVGRAAALIGRPRVTGDATVFGRAAQDNLLPIALGFGLCVWGFRSDLGVTLNVAAVSALGDQSGNGKDISQGTGSAQPAYVLNAYNGKPCLRIVAASSQFLSRAATNSFGGGAYTMIYVVKNNTLPGAFTGGIGCTSTSAGVSLGTNGNTRTDLIFGLEAFGVSAGNASTTVVETYAAWRPAASNHQGTFNFGTALTSGTAAHNNPGAGSALMLGAHLNSGAAGGFADVDFLEAYGYSGSIPLAAIRRIDHYTRSRYARAA